MCGVCGVSVCVHICVKLLFPGLVLGISVSHSVSSFLNGVKLSHVENHGFSYNTAPHPASPSSCSFKERTVSANPGERNQPLGLLRRVGGLPLKCGVNWLFGQFGLHGVFACLLTSTASLE